MHNLIFQMYDEGEREIHITSALAEKIKVGISNRSFARILYIFCLEDWTSYKGCPLRRHSSQQNSIVI